jgi:predicted nucleic acid-binding protein
MRWCFGGSRYAYKVLADINAGQRAYVPLLWLYEVISVTAESQRKGLLTAHAAHEIFDDLRSLEIEIDTSTERENVLGNAHKLAVEYRLSGYDAVYLDLASLDQDYPCQPHQTKSLTPSSPNLRFRKRALASYR